MSQQTALPGGVFRSWREGAPGQRLGLIAFAVICVGLLALTAVLARRPQFGVLYANLQQEDAAQVLGQLRKLKVPYRVSAGGTIEVPSDTVAELRLDLAAAGMPTGGQTGFELLDRTRVGLSDFGERLNYQRALQGELARTIAHLESVEQARVHLALPQERLYADEQERATASVVLGLRSGRRVDPTQVRSIVHLVSGAVEGLAPESVTILDTEGRLLSQPDDTGLGGVGLAAASNQLQLQREYEREVERAVQSMLDRVVGPGKSIVRASATMDFDRVETETELYQPAGESSGVLESRTETRETYRGLSEPGAIGIPGVSSNTGTAPALSGVRGGADQYEQTQVSSQYRVSRTVERKVQPPGQLERISLSVFVDEQANVGEPEAFQESVAVAAGLDLARGDRVIVTTAQFQPQTPEEGGSKAFAARDFYFRVGRDFAAIILTAIFLKFVTGALRRRSAPQSLPVAAAASPVTSSQHASATPTPGGPAGELNVARGGSVLRDWLGAETHGDEEGAAVASAPAESV